MRHFDGVLIVFWLVMIGYWLWELNQGVPDSYRGQHRGGLLICIASLMGSLGARSTDRRWKLAMSLGMWVPLLGALYLIPSVVTANLTIRLGTSADAAALAELAARTFRDTFASNTDPSDMAMHLATAYGVRQQGAELADPNIVTLLADADGQLAAYAQLRREPAPTCVTGDAPIELWRFYVSPEWHGRGIAQALMRCVDAEAGRVGASTLWLGVWERNERAKSFYRKSGFVDVGSHVFMVGKDPQTDRIMARPVAPTRG